MYIVGLPELGGSNRSLISLLRDLKKQGHSIHVVMSMKGALSDELDNMNIEYSCIYHRLFLYPDLKTLKDYIMFIPRLIFTLIADLLAFLKLNKLVKRINPDIIHTNVSCINIGFGFRNLIRYLMSGILGNIIRLISIEYQSLQ